MKDQVKGEVQNWMIRESDDGFFEVQFEMDIPGISNNCDFKAICSFRVMAKAKEFGKKLFGDVYYFGCLTREGEWIDDDEEEG